MKYIEKRLGLELELMCVSKPQAMKYYKDGVEVFVKILDDAWLSFNLFSKSTFPLFGYNVNYYIEGNPNVIITSNNHVLTYLSEKGISGLNLESASMSDVKGKIVYKFGESLPLSLISQCKAYYEVRYLDPLNKKSGFKMKRYVCREES